MRASACLPVYSVTPTPAAASYARSYVVRSVQNVVRVVVHLGGGRGFAELVRRLLPDRRVLQ